MKFKVYIPSDIILFGQYKGSSLSKIFKYHPDYILWAIQNRESFVIDMETFEKEQNPTPVMLKAGEYESTFRELFLQRQKEISAKSNSIAFQTWKKQIKDIAIKQNNAIRLEDIDKLPSPPAVNIPLILWPRGNNLLALVDKFIAEENYRPIVQLFKFSDEIRKINTEKMDKIDEYYEMQGYSDYLPDYDFDYEKEYFDTMTDGQLGDYNDFIRKGGKLDNIDDWSGR